MKSLKLFFGFTVVVLPVFVFSLYRGWIRLNHPDRLKYPVHGLDVSHHQKKIDWSSIASQEYSFVYIKATEGGDFQDRRFAENWREAGKVGLFRGAYHFFTLCRSGSEQAENFIRTVPRTDDALPPAIDLEFGGNCSKRPDMRHFAAELNAFVRTIRGHYGREPILYVTGDFLEKYRAANLCRYDLWIRNVFYEPSGAGECGWQIWQYANRERIAGIKTFVDLNAYRGDRRSFRKWARGN